jgi:ABC-type iron transport system FetAB permease component
MFKRVRRVEVFYINGGWRIYALNCVVLCRGVAQLTVLAYILTPGFALNRWWLTIVYSIILLLVSSAEAVSRPPAAYEVPPSTL